MPHPEETPIAYLNGHFIPFAQAQLPVFDLGVIQGATVTERLRTFHHKAYQLDEHLERLHESLEKCGIEFSFQEKEISDVVDELIFHNSRLNCDAELSVVIFVTAGQGLGDANGLIRESTPTYCLYTSPLPIQNWHHWYREGVSLVIPDVKQIPHQSLSPQIKQRSRLHWYIADRQAKDVDPKAMALLTDLNGFVTETSSGNLFIVKDGELFTPRRETTLPGIAQAHVMKIAKTHSINCIEQNLTINDALDADEAFLTSSTYCVVPVASLDQNKIGAHVPGPITKKITELWVKEVGVKFDQPFSKKS